MQRHANSLQREGRRTFHCVADEAHFDRFHVVESTKIHISLGGSGEEGAIKSSRRVRRTQITSEWTTEATDRCEQGRSILPEGNSPTGHSFVWSGPRPKTGKGLVNAEQHNWHFRTRMTPKKLLQTGCPFLYLSGQTPRLPHPMHWLNTPSLRNIDSFEMEVLQRASEKNLIEQRKVSLFLWFWLFDFRPSPQG